MKKILSLAILFAVVFQMDANAIKPESPLGVSIVKSGAVVKLFYRGEESGTVHVVIYNSKGTVVYKETLPHTEDFMRPYNFAALPSGTYTIKLTDDRGTKYKTFEHRRTNTRILANLTRVNGDDERYVLTIPDQDASVVTVRIYGRDKKLLYRETLDLQGDFAKLYNFSHLGGGNTVEVSDRHGNAKRFMQPIK